MELVLAIFGIGMFICAPIFWGVFLAELQAEKWREEDAERRKQYSWFSDEG